MAAMNPTMRQELEAHATKELFGSQTYLAASFFFEEQNFRGIASYMRKEADSEREHAMEFYDYLHKRGEKVDMSKCHIQPVTKASEWQTCADVFKHLLQLELDVTDAINRLVDVAVSHKDRAAELFLNGFVEKQVDEVDEMRCLVEKAKAYDALPGLMYHLDKELS